MITKNGWEFLFLKYSRIGYVDQLKAFNKVIYQRSGSLVYLLGFSWIAQ